MIIHLQKILYRKVIVPVFEKLNFRDSDAVLMKIKLSILKQVAVQRKQKEIKQLVKR